MRAVLPLWPADGKRRQVCADDVGQEFGCDSIGVAKPIAEFGGDLMF